jgi:hypothetical protein
LRKAQLIKWQVRERRNKFESDSAADRLARAVLTPSSAWLARKTRSAEPEEPTMSARYRVLLACLSALAASLGGFCSARIAGARDAKVPHVFQAGRPARAQEVNQNFAELEQAINTSVAELITMIETGLASVQEQLDQKVDRDELTAAAPSGGATLGYSRATFVNTTVTNVRINGGAITAPVAPGTTMSVDLDYSIQNTSCPGCIEQILVGFTHGGGPQCAFNGVSGSPGKTGTASLTFTAPSEPGTYYLGLDRGQAVRCTGGWWTGRHTAPANRIATIIVL